MRRKKGEPDWRLAWKAFHAAFEQVVEAFDRESRKSERAMKPKDMMWMAACLRRVRAADVDFRSALKHASVAMLQDALVDLEQKPVGGGNGARIGAILGELRRRRRQSKRGPR